MRGFLWTHRGSRNEAVQEWARLCDALEETTWFAWSEQDLQLPTPGPAPQDPTGWDRISVFNPRVELRWIRWDSGHSLQLLTENSGMPGILALDAAAWEQCPDSLEAVEGWRLLVGRPARVGGVEGRVEVRYPRVLDYGVGGTGRDLVLRVVSYYDHDGVPRLERSVAVEAHDLPDQAGHLGRWKEDLLCPLG